MKRRDVLQAMAVAPVLLALPGVAVAEPRKARRVIWGVYPDGEGRFAPGFQQLIEKCEAAGIRPRGNIWFEPMGADGKPWLLHPSWGPPSAKWPYTRSTLFTPIGMVFGSRHWLVIDRAVDLRQHYYWREERDPIPTTPEDTFRERASSSFDQWRAWRKQVRAKLSYVLVKFETCRRGA